MSAKDTSNMAATAKRSATSIQHLARCLDGLSIKDKATLEAAATILQLHGNRAKNKAAGEKRVEQAREKAQAKARAETRQIIATWPQTSTLDRLALIHATRDGWRRLEGGLDRRDPRWELQYAHREAIDDIVSDAVMYAVPYSTSTAAVPVTEHIAQRRALVDQISARPGVVALAEQWEERMSASFATNLPQRGVAKDDKR